MQVTTTSLQFRARTAQIARDEKVSADTAAAHAVAPQAPADDRDGVPRIASRTNLWNPDSLDELQPRERAKPTYDLAAYLARRCAQAYLAADEAAKLVAAEGGVDFAPFSRFSDAAFGYRRGETLVIAFRGTTGGLNALRQWPLTNLRAFPVRRPSRHLGFQMAWDRLRSPIIEWIERTLPAGGTLMLTGHSLGGAIAILAAYELAEDCPVQAVVTIGAPRVGLTAFRDQYLARSSRPGSNAAERPVVLGAITRRITHADDFVSRVPPGPIDRHVGEKSRLDARGVLIPGVSRGAIERLYAGLDAAVGWCYRQLDSQMTPAGTVSKPVFGSGIPGTPLTRILGGVHPAKPDRPLGRLAKDVVKLQGQVPFLSLVTLTALQWTLIGAGAAISVGVFLISIADLGAHRSKLYVDAFMRRYPLDLTSLDLAGISGIVRAALEERRVE